MVALRTRFKHFPFWLSLLPASMLLLFSMLLAAAPDAPQEPKKVVYVAQIEGIIDLGLAPYIERVIQDATQAGAAAVVLDINTFGGRVDAAVQVRDALLNSKVPTVAFINKRAISAGALISLAAEKIVMVLAAPLVLQPLFRRASLVLPRSPSERRQSPMCVKSFVPRQRPANGRSQLQRPWSMQMLSLQA